MLNYIFHLERFWRKLKLKIIMRMDSNCRVIKSKSSNTAIRTKSGNRTDKKSRSNVEFQKNNLKKRGMYVEKKPTTTRIHSKGNAMFFVNEMGGTDLEERKAIKPQFQRRADRKQFLKSVLTILSKTTAATQYPEEDHNIGNIKKRNKINIKGKRKVIDKDTVKYEDKSVGTEGKYKSNTLNAQVNKSIDEDKLVVLQPRKDIIQTPSIYSECGLFKCTDSSPFPENNIVDNAKLINELNNVFNNKGLKEQIADYKMKDDKKVRIDTTTATLVENTKDDKGLYNFFVDLLQTTFNTYNVEAENNTTTNLPSEERSAAVFEIDESVAEILNVKDYDASSMSAKIIEKPSKRYYCTTESDFNDLVEQPENVPDSVNQQLLPKSQRRGNSKLKTQSFFYNENRLTDLKSKSTVMDKRSSFSRKNNKQTLLNMFKQELKLDADSYEDPQNLYQALHLIARNKRKCQKSIRFNKDSIKKTDSGFNKECMFKRRKVISLSTKLTKKQLNEQDIARSNYRSVTSSTKCSQFSNKTKSKYIKSEYSTNLDVDESNHSLEVYSFDDEITGKYATPLPNEVVLHHSSPSLSDGELGINDPIHK
ncbi:uncharacterized protein LOC131849054 [Achroia grisella]|uniref:uncharacterized protein LOC131849054 n=1 Tax=Achroia grisella TaxID=688607 RepID=UPI0027D3394E|nr:uncharacterized protein LOC131849054 [Achroia grisella]